MRSPDARWLRLGGVAISVLALGGVVWLAAHQEAPRLPSSGGQIAALCGAIGVYAAATCVRAERWRLLLLGTDALGPRSDCYALTLVGYAGNNLLPARGGDALRAYLMAPPAKTTIRNVIGTLLAERILDVAVLFAIYLGVAYVALRGIQTPDARGLAIAAASLAFIGSVALIYLRSSKGRPRAHRIIGFLAPIGNALRQLRGKAGLLLLLITLAIWMCESATYLLTAAATGVSMSPVESLYVIGVASIFVLIPSGPAYVGTFDAAVIFGLKAIGRSGQATLAYLVTLRFVLIVPITLAGAVVLFTKYRGGASLRAATTTSG
jgi:uncharacterized protein (TIRG00374 family)